MEEPNIYNVKTYINNRYDRWHEYAKYVAIQAGIESDADDILHEVITNLLQKPEKQLIDLYEAEGKGRTRTTKNLKLRQLDFFVQKMIRTYATSDTAPWLFKKNKLIPKKKIHTSDLLDETEQAIQTTENEGFRLDVYKQFIDNYPLLNACERIAIRYRFENETFTGIQDKAEQKFFRGHVMRAKFKLNKHLKIKQL